MTIEDYIPLAKSAAYNYGKRYFKLVEPQEIYSCTYLALVNSFTSYDGRGDIAGWLNFKIRKSILDFVRKQDPVGHLEKFEPFNENIKDHGFSNGHEITRFENHNLIEWLMDMADLKEKDRLRITRYYFEGLTNREIGELENRKEAAISTSIKKSLAKMRGVLKCGTLSLLQ